MKKRYLISIVMLGLMFLVFEWAILFSPVGGCPQLPNSIQGAGIFVALLTAIIALSTADRKRRWVNIKIETSIDSQGVTYRKSEMTEYLQNLYKGSSDKFESHQVNFRMTNLSGFTLENPTLTFMLPYEKQPPYKEERQQIYSTRCFTTNILNPPQVLFEEKIILSTPFVPFWNEQDSMTAWVRMLLEDGGFEPFTVSISVNCANADGRTYPIRINSEMLKR